MSTELFELVREANRFQYGLNQAELDDCASLLDRMEELEIYIDSPSISDQEREDAEFELSKVVERVHHYTMNA